MFITPREYPREQLRAVGRLLFTTTIVGVDEVDEITLAGRVLRIRDMIAEGDLDVAEAPAHVEAAVIQWAEATAIRQIPIAPELIAEIIPRVRAYLEV